MSVPRWTHALLRRLADERSEDVIGDLEEAHRRRLLHQSAGRARLLSSLEALELSLALLRARIAQLIPKFSWLDYKLGFRMLRRYPGLTLVGGVAIAFAIGLGAATFEFVNDLVRPTLPLMEGERVVRLRLWHTPSGSVEEQALDDFEGWKQQVKSVENLSAFRTVERNLTTADGLSEPVTAAEISAAAFSIARVPPLLGRTLRDSDEQLGASAVVVIGYDLWQDRFFGDPTIVGRTVRLSGEESTVVGVMPEGFAFPVAHRLWIPFRQTATPYGRRQGPEIDVIGRLARGATLAEAQSELNTIGQRRAADFPDTHQHIRAEIGQYPRLGISKLEIAAFRSINLFMVMLLVLICSNIALLMFARAASRENELVVRTALGASRSRIGTQLFAEALVLGGCAAVIGLGAATFALQWWLRVSAADSGRPQPFWFDASLSPATVLYAILLTVLGAVIAGVIPALKITRGVGARLRAAAAGGGGPRFGGFWTAVIVAQVAVTVAFPATAFFVRRDVVEKQRLDVGFPMEQYLSVRLEVDREPPPGVSADQHQAALLNRFQNTYHELERRIDAEPAVAGVTFASRLPRTLHQSRSLEVEENAVQGDSIVAHLAGPASVDLKYFDVVGAPILAGRAFNTSDLESGRRVVIVNQSFVRTALGERNPIGRRIRYLERESRDAPWSLGPWYEIVGVVRDLGVMFDGPAKGAGVYHPTTANATTPFHMVVHMRGDAQAFAPRLRNLAMTVDPTLRLHDVLRLDRVGSELWLEFDFLFRLLVIICAVALLLSLTAIYAVMAFTVSKRTREIGIRLALGSDPRVVIAAILARPVRQVATGVAFGGVLVGMLVVAVSGAISATEFAVLLAYAAGMMAVCMLACVVPTRKAMRIQPTDALRTDV